MRKLLLGAWVAVFALSLSLGVGAAVVWWKSYPDGRPPAYPSRDVEYDGRPWRVAARRGSWS